MTPSRQSDCRREWRVGFGPDEGAHLEDLDEFELMDLIADAACVLTGRGVPNFRLAAGKVRVFGSRTE